MERYNVDAVRAFAMLRELSRTSNTRLVDVAQRVVDTAVRDNRDFAKSAPGRIRTCDTGFRRAVLYPLSYEGARVPAA
jgi:hypothetical protein